MKKALLVILAIVALCFIIANIDYLSDFFNTMMTGALVPLIVAIVLMLARHLVQAQSYDAAFAAVGHATGFWHNVTLIFSLVFINTFCLFSGATGVAFIIDDAHRQGCDAGQATGGAFLSQIGYFAAVFVISVIGFLTMWLSGHMNLVFLVGGLLLAGVLVILSSMFFIGHFKPRILFRLFMLIEKLANWIMHLIHRSMRSGWGRTTARSFVSTANLLAENPKGSVITITYASLSAMLNMCCLVAIGYAFGFEHVEALIAAFAVAAISVILSPTPQGVGVVEAMITAILTAYGCSVATAAAIALVYRGIMFWIPFCIGAVLLSQTGFFKTKKSATEVQKHKDIAWISGTLLLLIGAVNIVLALVPDVLLPYTMLTSWIDMSSLLVGIPLVIASAVLMVFALLLIARFRTAWAITEGMLVIIAGVEFLFTGTWQVAIVMLVMFAWLFWKREAFDRPMSREAIRGDIEAWKRQRAEKKAKRVEDESNRKKGRRLNTGTSDSQEKGSSSSNDGHAVAASGDPSEVGVWEAQAARGEKILDDVLEEKSKERVPGESITLE